jgi:uncharacterized protein
LQGTANAGGTTGDGGRPAPADAAPARAATTAEVGAPAPADVGAVNPSGTAEVGAPAPADVGAANPSGAADVGAPAPADAAPAQAATTADGGRTAPADPGYVDVRSEEELDAVLGEPTPVVARKVRDRLGPLDRAWLAASPLCLVATTDAEGRCDVSPKGDPAGGLAVVLDDRTVALAERPGNRRADGFRNVLVNPHAGLLFLVPGRGDTLRVNGRARVLRDAPFFDRLVVAGHRPALALLVEVEEVFFHCSKAFLRSRLWKPETWAPDAVPSRAVISKALERTGEDLAALEEYYGPSYAERLYG